MSNISSKELNYVKDFLSWELLAAKKCNEHANQEQDPNVKQALSECARGHQENYNRLLGYVEQLNQQGGQMN
ncbi:MAG: hypothetical protein FH749_03990 [Firmicutes bacterium]|nr:hypothetical protein [Bacillota bacterium]